MAERGSGKVGAEVNVLFIFVTLLHLPSCSHWGTDISPHFNNSTTYQHDLIIIIPICHHKHEITRHVPLHLTFSCRNTLNMYKDCTFSFIDFRSYSTWKQQNMDFRTCQTLKLLLFWVPKHTGLREHKKQSYSYMLRIQRIQNTIQIFAKFPKSDFH